MRIQDWTGENGDRGWWLRALAFAVVLGVVLGILGPFGSFLNGDISLRIASWCGNLVGGTVIIGLLTPPLTRLAMRLGLSRLAALALALIVATVPASALAALYGNWLWPSAVARVRPVDWYAQSLVIVFAMLALWVLVEGARHGFRHTPPPAPPPAADTGEPVLCLQMEDHYVRIHRASGSRLELMPLRDAVTRFGGDGLQVHRSWWVASSAVTSTDRDARSLRLHLSNGLVVPVARNRINEVRAKGWLKD